MIHRMIPISKSLVLLAMLIASAAAEAFNFSPIEATFRPAGIGSTQTFTIENPSTRPIAVEVTLFERVMLIDGSDQLEPSEGLFDVYPTQMIIEPGARQAVRARWTGPERIEREQAFRLIAEQLPIDLDDSETEGGALNLLVRYVAALYVQPASAQAKLSLTLHQNSDSLVIEAVNTGNAHAILRATDFEIFDDQGSIEWSEAEQQQVGAVNILAGAVRRIQIPHGGRLNDRSLNVRWTRSSD